MYETLVSAAEQWRNMVEEENAQSERVRGLNKVTSDSWEAFAERFRPDAQNADDPLMQSLKREIDPQHTVLDVGAGAGRLALPLSMHCQQVVAVEPSASMGAILEEESQKLQRDNITLVTSNWEDAEVQPTDVVLCVQVLYTVKSIVPFIRKLESCARDKVLVVLYDNPPFTQANALWPSVHGEERKRLPMLKQLMEVLWEMDIYPNLEMLPTQEFRGYESKERAVQSLRPRLFVEQGGDGERRLQQALDEMLEQVGDRFKIKGWPLQRPGLVSWRT